MADIDIAKIAKNSFFPRSKVNFIAEISNYGCRSKGEIDKKGKLTPLGPDEWFYLFGSASFGMRGALFHRIATAGTSGTRFLDFIPLTWTDQLFCTNVGFPARAEGFPVECRVPCPMDVVVRFSAVHRVPPNKGLMSRHSRKMGFRGRDGA